MEWSAIVRWWPSCWNQIFVFSMGHVHSEVGTSTMASTTETDHTCMYMWGGGRSCTHDTHGGGVWQMHINTFKCKNTDHWWDTSKNQIFCTIARTTLWAIFCNQTRPVNESQQSCSLHIVHGPEWKHWTRETWECAHLAENVWKSKGRRYHAPIHCGCEQCFTHQAYFANSKRPKHTPWAGHVKGRIPSLAWTAGLQAKHTQLHNGIRNSEMLLLQMVRKNKQLGDRERISICT